LECSLSPREHLTIQDARKPPAPMTQMVWEEGDKESAEGMITTTLWLGNGRESRRKMKEKK